jgi:hypothetical protein
LHRETLPLLLFVVLSSHFFRPSEERKKPGNFYCASQKVPGTLISTPGYGCALRKHTPADRICRLSLFTPQARFQR